MTGYQLEMLLRIIDLKIEHSQLVLKSSREELESVIDMEIEMLKDDLNRRSEQCLPC